MDISIDKTQCARVYNISCRTRTRIKQFLGSCSKMFSFGVGISMNCFCLRMSPSCYTLSHLPLSSSSSSPCSSFNSNNLNWIRKASSQGQFYFKLLSIFNLTKIDTSNWCFQMMQNFLMNQLKTQNLFLLRMMIQDMVHL